MKPSHPAPPAPPPPAPLPELPPFERFLLVLGGRVAPLEPRLETVASLREASSLRLLPPGGLLVPPDKAAAHVVLVVKGLLRTFEVVKAAPEGAGRSAGKDQAKGAAKGGGKGQASQAGGNKGPAKDRGKEQGKGPPKGSAKAKGSPGGGVTERTRGFFEVGAVLADVPALLSGRPSGLAVQAVEEAAVLRLPWGALRQACDADHALERWCRLLLEEAFKAAQDGVAGLTPGGRGDLPVEVRYRAFLEERPMLAGRLAPRLVASYLGISTEALAQLRSRRFRTPAAR